MKKETVTKILLLLDENYGIQKDFFHFERPYELLIATLMSAQTTDNQIEKVTNTLFQKYTILQDYANADLEELMEDIKSVGLYRTKAKNIIGCCKMLLDNYDGNIPSDINELVKLPGIGRKTGNLYLGDIYGIPAIVVDTHVKRIVNQLGFTTAQDPVKIEKELMNILPQEHWIRINFQLVLHGRKYCIAKKPKCEDCFLKLYCENKII